jgi:transposase-like protein
MLIIERLRHGRTVAHVAAAAGGGPRTARKWRHRFATEGKTGPQEVVGQFQKRY